MSGRACAACAAAGRATFRRAAGDGARLSPRRAASADGAGFAAGGAFPNVGSAFSHAGGADFATGGAPSHVGSTGFTALAEALDGYASRLTDAAAEAAQAAAEAVAEAAHAACPLPPEALTLEAQPTADGALVRASGGAALALELGTTRRAPAPFLRPALLAEGEALPGRVLQGLRR